MGRPYPYPAIQRAFFTHREKQNTVIPSLGFCGMYLVCNFDLLGLPMLQVKMYSNLCTSSAQIVAEP
jgi:hypothetical protein